jgi:tetratricopeptide (TPR) repeat protein
MFFMRLRRGAKWAFIVLIFAFAFGFLFSGVGGGGGGDVISQLLGMRGSNATKSAESDVSKHPNRASAWIRLAQVYDGQNKRGDAIKAYEKYLKLKPNESGGFAQLGRLQQEIATLRWNRYQEVQSEMTVASGPLTTNPLDTIAGTDYLSTAYKNLLNTQLTNAYGSYLTAARAWESTYKSYARAVPKTNVMQLATVEFQLGQAASSAADYPSAIKAYKNFLRLTPKSPLATQVKKILAELQKANANS